MTDSFNEQMVATSKLCQAGDFDQALLRAQALRRELFDAPIIDADRLGWAVYYELRCHYELGHTDQGWKLLHSDPYRLCQPGPKNHGWMCSVAAELAARLELPEQVVAWGEECFWLRSGTDDAPSRMMCCDTVCTLLERLNRADLNISFAAELVRLGREHRAMRPALRGIGYLLDNLQKAAHEAVQAAVLEAFGELDWIGTALTPAKMGSSFAGG